MGQPARTGSDQHQSPNATIARFTMAKPVAGSSLMRRLTNLAGANTS